MKKMSIIIREKTILEHEVIIEVPNNKNIDTILDEAENEDNYNDVLYFIEKSGCKIIESDNIEDDDIEITRYSIL